MPLLTAGEVLARIDAFALTANNVSYGVSGDMIGYWRFFPCEAPWGSCRSGGSQQWPGRAAPRFRSGSESGASCPWPRTSSCGSRTSRGALSSTVRRTAPNSRVSTIATSARPATRRRWRRNGAPSLHHVVRDRRLPGRQRPLRGRSGSRAERLVEDRLRLGGRAAPARGIARARHRRHVRGQRAVRRSLGFYDLVVSYGDFEGLDPDKQTVVVDMAGSAEILARVQRHFRERLVYSCVVGPPTGRSGGPLPNSPEPSQAKPSLFFAPGQIAEGEQYCGPGEILRRVQAEGVRIARETAHLRKSERITGRRSRRGGRRSRAARRPIACGCLISRPNDSAYC